MSLCPLSICGCSLKPKKLLWSQRMPGTKIQFAAISVHALNLLHFSTYAAGDWQVIDKCSTTELKAQTLSYQHSLEDVSI